MKLRHIALIGSLFPFLLAIVLFFGVLISAEDDDGGGGSSSGVTGMNLSAEVLKHQPMVEKYAREYGISEYVPYLLAIIQVESGGTAEDVMQRKLNQAGVQVFCVPAFFSRKSRHRGYKRGGTVL